MVYCVQPLVENHEVLTAMCVPPETTRSRYKRVITRHMKIQYKIICVYIYIL